MQRQLAVPFPPPLHLCVSRPRLASLAQTLTFRSPPLLPSYPPLTLLLLSSLRRFTTVTDLVAPV
jgi:hypothetical protein